MALTRQLPADKSEIWLFDLAARKTTMPNDAAADGRLLIIQSDPQEASFLRVEVVLNWLEELKQRVPVVK